jgi:O-antigen/teichoic acid export membrane protein
VAVVPSLLPALFGRAFRPAVPVAQILLAAALIQAFRRIAAEGLRGLGSGSSASIAELVFAAVFVGALIPLSDSLHAKGAAFALMLGTAAAGITLLALVTLDGRRSARAHAAIPLRSTSGRNHGAI